MYVLLRTGLNFFLLTLLVQCTTHAQLSSSTTLGGYGNAYYMRDGNLGTSTANLERFVLFLGHSFDSKISVFSELEVEDAKVSGDDAGGEVALEQAYLKFDFDQDHYITAGLFIPRIGILNENHLPTTFNGNERTQVETYILPSTWRELGIGYYGSLNSVPLNFSVALLNGLNSASFEHGTGIREGRYEGKNASANNLALMGAVQLNESDFKTQISGYYGGTVGLAAAEADTLHLDSGVFGTPVFIGEADVQFEKSGFSARILGTIVSIPDAANINQAYNNNTPSREYGFYAEVAYNIFASFEIPKTQQLILFTRFEKLDMNASIPSNGITDGTLNQQHWIAGLTYLPINNVVVKADARFVKTGESNPALVVTPNPDDLQYDRTNTFLTLGIGFSF